MWNTLLVMISVNLFIKFLNKNVKNISPDEIERLGSKQYPRFYPLMYGLILTSIITIFIICMVLFFLFSFNILTSNEVTGYINQQPISILQLILFISFLIASIQVSILGSGLSLIYLVNKFSSSNFKDYMKYQQIKSGKLVEDDSMSKIMIWFIVALIVYLVLIALFYLKIFHF